MSPCPVEVPLQLYWRMEDIMAALNISQNTVRAWVKKGFLPKPERRGQRWVRWKMEELKGCLGEAVLLGQDRWATKGRVAQMLGISETTVRIWVVKKNLPGPTEMAEGHYRWLESEILTWKNEANQSKNLPQ